MTKKEFDELLKRFDGWKEDLRNQLKPFKNEDEIPVEELRRIVGLGLAGEPLKQFLTLAPQEIEAAGAPPQAAFDDFMASLARSMVATQKSLDRESTAYLASIAGQPHIQPSVFKLPRLEAQMKFGLEVDEKTKLNLLFWGKNRETSELNQQGINFEIVSVPAAPGAMEAARRAVARWSLVVDPQERSFLLAGVAGQKDDALLASVVEAARTSPDAVAFLDLGDERRHLVLFEGGAWLLEAGLLEAKEELLRDLVLELGAQQRKLSGG
jgi:hypothetical protein